MNPWNIIANLTVAGVVHRLRPGEEMTVADGRPRDLLSLALLNGAGQFQIEGPPDAVWRALIAGLALVALLAGRRRIIQGYWPPDLRSPW